MRHGCRRLCAALACLLPGALPAAPIQVQDMVGRTVQLERAAQRIVALAPHTVENTFSAGAGSRLVGVVAYSDYPEAARQIEKVGSHQAWSLEKIVRLQPDLVILWASGNGMDKLADLERLGFTVYVSESREPADISRTIRAIATLAGTTAEGEREARRLEQSFAALAQEYASLRTMTVFYQVWHEPLQTLNGRHMVSKVIELCGGRNVFADAPNLAPKINLESVLARDPEIIVASGMDRARPEWLDNWLAFPALTAVRNRALVFVDPDHLQRPTARLLMGAEHLCRQIDQFR